MSLLLHSDDSAATLCRTFISLVIYLSLKYFYEFLGLLQSGTV